MNCITFVQWWSFHSDGPSGNANLQLHISGAPCDTRYSSAWLMKVQVWTYSKQHFLSIFSCLYKLVQCCWTPCNSHGVTESYKGTGRLCLCWLHHSQKTSRELSRQGNLSSMVCIMSPDLVWIFCWCTVSGVLQHIPSFCVWCSQLHVAMYSSVEAIDLNHDVHLLCLRKGISGKFDYF